MDARKGNIYEILNGNKQFLIPVYQRFYSWDIDQCKRLWNDIVEMQRKGKAILIIIAYLWGLVANENKKYNLKLKIWKNFKFIDNC